MTVHTTRIAVFPPHGHEIATERMKHSVIEAIVSLYRRSQQAGEEGRLFLLKQPDMVSGELEIGLLRTTDDQQIGALTLFFGDSVRELSEDEILALFKAS